MRVARLPVPESKVISYSDNPHTEFACQDLGNEALRREHRDFWAEGKDQNLLDALPGHQGGALVAGGHQPRRALRRDHVRWMRVECQDARPQIPLGGQFPHPPQDAPVARMHAVEVADGQGRGSEVGWHFLQAANVRPAGHHLRLSSPEARRRHRLHGLGDLRHVPDGFDPPANVP